MRSRLIKICILACVFILSLPQSIIFADELLNEEDGIMTITFVAEEPDETEVIINNATLTKKGRLLYKNIYYALETGEDGSLCAVVTGTKKEKASYTIPASIYYEDVEYKVVTIGEESFAGSALKSITLPDSIELIDDMAFAGCVNLEKITIPKQCARIGMAAFMGCEGLSEVDFNDAYCHELGEAAFAMSGVKNTTLSIITDSVGASCFYGCKDLKTVTFGANCDYIGEGAFTDCPSLEKFKKVKMNKYLVIENGCIYSKNGKTLYSAALATGDVILKDTVEEILPYSFENNDNITTVVIPGSAKEIPEGCFINCSNLDSVVIMNGVAKIGENSFYNCVKLTSVSIPASVSEICDNPFLLCKKLSGIIVNSKSQYYKVTNNMLISKENNYVIAAPVTSGTVTLPSSCKGVAAYAFAFNTKLKKLTVNSKCRTFEEGAFYGCSKLCYVYMPNRKVNMSVSEVNENNEYCGIFGECAASIEVNLPFSAEAGSANSIESNLKRHCNGEMLLTQR